MHLTFIDGKPALLVVSKKERWIVISDIHIGFAVLSGLGHEYDMDEATTMSRRIIKLGEDYKCNKLLLLGDLKHSIGNPTTYEKNQLELFFKILTGKFYIWITLGNHDAGVESFADKRVFIAGKNGIVLDDVLFCHGHSVPNGFLKYRAIVMGHIHPHALIGVENTPVWAIFVNKHKTKPNRIVVVPHFNDVLTQRNYSPGNPTTLSPLFRKLDITEFRLEQRSLFGEKIIA